MGAREVGPWVGEQKPLDKTPLGGNPSPEKTYLPTSSPFRNSFTTTHHRPDRSTAMVHHKCKRLLTRSGRIWSNLKAGRHPSAHPWENGDVPWYRFLPCPVDCYMCLCCVSLRSNPKASAQG